MGDPTYLCYGGEGVKENIEVCPPQLLMEPPYAFNVEEMMSDQLFCPYAADWICTHDLH